MRTCLNGNKRPVRPKIALFIPTLAVGGSERQLVELAKGLDKEKWDVLVITMYKGGDLFERAGAIPGISMVTLKKRNCLSFIPDLIGTIRRENVDILNCYLLTAQFYGLFAKIFTPKVRLVFRIGDAIDYKRSFNAKNAVANFTLRRSMSKADLYIFNSQAGKKAKSLMVPDEKVRVIHNGIDTGHFRPLTAWGNELKRKLGLNDGTALVGSVGNFSIYKDHITFIKAAKLVRSAAKNTHFVIMGDHDNPLGMQARAYAESLEMGPFFSFLGVRDDVERILPGLDVACSSSVTEGFSNAICESMACAVPCVVTDVGDSAVIVGDTGMVVPPSDPEALAEAVLSLLNMPSDERTHLGKMARKRIEENYPVLRMITETEDVYRDVLGRCG